MQSDTISNTIVATQSLKSPIGNNLASSSTRTLTPSKGALAYDNTEDKLYFGGNSFIWKELASASSTDLSGYALLNGSTLTSPTLISPTLITPLISTITNTGTLTLPTSTDTLVGGATTDTLTNKTITGTTNTVDANALKTTGASVNVSSSSPPSTNQVLVATSSTTATWQTLSSGSTDANSLQTTGASVVVSGATPPSTGQALIATSSTTATWQTLSSGSTTANSLATTGASVVVSTASPPTTGQTLIATGSTAATWQTPSDSAGSLKTTGASVVVSTASPPTTGQVLKATGATTATWQSVPTEEEGIVIARYEGPMSLAVSNNGLFAVTKIGQTVILRIPGNTFVASPGYYFHFYPLAVEYRPPVDYEMIVPIIDGPTTSSYSMGYLYIATSGEIYIRTGTYGTFSGTYAGTVATCVCYRV